MFINYSSILFIPELKKKKSFKYVMLKLSSEILESLPKRFTKIKQIIFNY